MDQEPLINKNSYDLNKARHISAFAVFKARTKIQHEKDPIKRAKRVRVAGKCKKPSIMKRKGYTKLIEVQSSEDGDNGNENTGRQKFLLHSGKNKLGPSEAHASSLDTSPLFVEDAESQPFNEILVSTNGFTAVPILESSGTKARTKRKREGETSTVKMNKKRRRKTLPEHSDSFKPERADIFNSLEEAERIFSWLIAPELKDNFFKSFFERKPLYINRKNKRYYDDSRIFSCAKFDQIMRDQHLEYSVNIDLTKYENGKRETLNPSGRAYAPVVWDYYMDGCSIRLLNPQTFSKKVFQLNSILQDVFGTFVGANVYLTPPGTQGFAPHWDDIEAFILQLEGKKQWKVYAPRCEKEQLPRFSSPNFTDADIGEPILEATLAPGDLLYLPRGFIHQGYALADEHSLHITLSTTQKNTFGDLVEKLVAQSVQTAIEEDVRFRESLPRNYMDLMGAVYDGHSSSQRSAFIKRLKSLMAALVKHASFDAACDQMAKGFLHSSLPPDLKLEERLCSIHGSNEFKWTGHVSGQSGADQCFANMYQISLKSRIKLIRKRCLRLVMEGNEVLIYHNIENTRIYQEKEPQCFAVPMSYANAVELLITTYPHFTTVENLDLETNEEKVEFATTFYDKGLLRTDVPFSTETT